MSWAGEHWRVPYRSRNLFAHFFLFFTCYSKFTFYSVLVKFREDIRPGSDHSLFSPNRIKILFTHATPKATVHFATETPTELRLASTCSCCLLALACDSIKKDTRHTFCVCEDEKATSSVAGCCELWDGKKEKKRCGENEKRKRKNSRSRWARVSWMCVFPLTFHFSWIAIKRISILSDDYFCVFFSSSLLWMENEEKLYCEKQQWRSNLSSTIGLRTSSLRENFRLSVLVPLKYRKQVKVHNFLCLINFYDFCFSRHWPPSALSTSPLATTYTYPCYIGQWENFDDVW